MAKQKDHFNSAIEETYRELGISSEEVRHFLTGLAGIPRDPPPERRVTFISAGISSRPNEWNCRCVEHDYRVNGSGF